MRILLQVLGVTPGSQDSEGRRGKGDVRVRCVGQEAQDLIRYKGRRGSGTEVRRDSILYEGSRYLESAGSLESRHQ